MRSRVVSLCVGCLMSFIAGRAAAQPVIPDADRYIKLGTRLPELPPGEGGELRVVAPQQSYRSADYILEVRGYFQPATQMPVVRLPAGPSECAWQFDRMPVGLYEAVV